MIQGELKHYTKYIKRLTLFCTAIGIKLKYQELDCGGMYQPARSTIKIDHDLDQTETIATILHELGHCMDDTFQTAVENKESAKVYSQIYTKKVSKKIRLQVLKYENRAWEYGAALAILLDIKLGTWYIYEWNESVKSYREGSHG